MKILFPRMEPEFDAESFTLLFPAEVDGQAIQCSITAEALEDHFGAASISETELVRAFGAHRCAIEKVAAMMIEATRGAPVLLHSGVFRLYSDDT